MLILIRAPDSLNAERAAGALRGLRAFSTIHTVLAPRAGPKYQPTLTCHHVPVLCFPTRHQAPPPPSTSAPPKYLSINISVPGGFLRGGANFYKGFQVKDPPGLDPNVRQWMLFYAFLSFSILFYAFLCLSMHFVPLFLGSTFRQSALRAPLRPQTRWEWDTWARIRTNRLSGFSKPDD